MNRLAHIAAALMTLALGACAQGPHGEYSLRQSIAEAIAPEGYTPGSPNSLPPMQQSAPYGYPSMANNYAPGGVSQVTISGGQINAHTGGMFSTNTDWRPHHTVEAGVIAECQTSTIQLQRSDKSGVGLPVYAIRIGSIVYIGLYPASDCSPPAYSQSFGGFGRYPLNIPGHIQGATVQINSGNAPAW